MAASKAKQGSAPAAATTPKADTKRVVLKQERVLVIGDEVPAEKLAEAAKLLGIKGSGDPTAVAWLNIGEFVGAAKRDAIEAYAGKPGTPDAMVGTFKAPTVAAMAGGERYKAPPKPLVERESIE